MRKQKRFFGAKYALVIAITAFTLQPAQANLPVIDGTNLAQNILSALEAVSQTAKQIQQYQTQLQQYENQLQNSLAPSVYIWDQVQNTINNLNNTVNTLNGYKDQLGSIDAYLSKFQDAAYYRGSPCFSAAGCSEAEKKAMRDAQLLASEAQKKANDAALRVLDQQFKQMQLDARNLSNLQRAAQGAQGQMQALGYANQLASNQANQLLEIRGLLIAQQNAVLTKMQADADEKARQQAADEKFLSGKFVPSKPKQWGW